MTVFAIFATLLLLFLLWAIFSALAALNGNVRRFVDLYDPKVTPPVGGDEKA